MARRDAPLMDSAAGLYDRIVGNAAGLASIVNIGGRSDASRHGGRSILEPDCCASSPSCRGSGGARIAAGNDWRSYINGRGSAWAVQADSRSIGAFQAAPAGKVRRNYALNQDALLGNVHGEVFSPFLISTHLTAWPAFQP